MILWRISNYVTLDGTGGMLAAGRWHNKGRPVIYSAPNPAAALLEVLVHSGEIDPADLPIGYKFLKVEAPDNITTETVPIEDLAKDWRDNYKITRLIGNQWLATNHSALLQVPSVIVPQTLNVLINPRHADSSKLNIIDTIDYPLDKRLRKQ